MHRSETNIKDLPFYDSVITVVFVDKYRLEFDSPYGNYVIKLPKDLKGIKINDTIRISKCVKTKYVKENHWITMSNRNFGLFVYNQMENYEHTKDKYTSISSLYSI